MCVLNAKCLGLKHLIYTTYPMKGWDGFFLSWRVFQGWKYLQWLVSVCLSGIRNFSEQSYPSQYPFPSCYKKNLGFCTFSKFGAGRLVFVHSFSEDFEINVGSSTLPSFFTVSSSLSSSSVLKSGSQRPCAAEKRAKGSFGLCFCAMSLGDNAVFYRKWRTMVKTKSLKNILGLTC